MKSKLNISNLLKISTQLRSKNLPKFERSLFNKLNLKGKFIGIKGPRGAGKTTLILQALNKIITEEGFKENEVLYLSCDHPQLIGVSLYELAEEFYNYGGKILALDEVHTALNFAKELKSINDTFDLKLFFSGSNAMEIDHSKADLSRRAVVYNLPSLSFREYLSLSSNNNYESYSLPEILSNHLDISLAIMKKTKPLLEFNNYLKYGAYPFFLESINDYHIKLLSIIQTTIEIDLSRIFSIEINKIDLLKKILVMLSETEPYELNISKLSSALGLSWPTLQNYLSYMEKGSLIHLIRTRSGMRSVVKRSKMLLHNPNLFYALAPEENVGSLRESFFISQVTEKYQINYYEHGDYIIDNKYIIEVGGPSKTNKQLKEKNSYLALDGIISGNKNKIPLWLFGFLY